MAVEVEEQSAFATEGFCYECAGGTCDVEGGGVELHEFHVAKDCAGAVGHGQAVACCDRRVGGFAVEPACAASCQNSRACPDYLHAGAGVIAEDADTLLGIVG